MAGLVPAIPIIEHCVIPIEIAGTSPAMTPRVLPLLRSPVQSTVSGQHWVTTDRGVVVVARRVDLERGGNGLNVRQGRRELRQTNGSGGEPVGRSGLSSLTCGSAKDMIVPFVAN